LLGPGLLPFKGKQARPQSLPVCLKAMLSGKQGDCVPGLWPGTPFLFYKSQSVRIMQEGYSAPQIDNFRYDGIL